MTSLEYLRNNIEESNIPKEHYEWEIAEMMEGYAYEYHQKQLILYGVSKSFTVDEIVSELEDSDHLDDAIMFFKESK
jgi:hypothetical protein